MPSLSSKSALLSATLLSTALASVPVFAQEETIEDERTSPLVTSSLFGSGGGTLSISSDGSIQVDSGTALTIDTPLVLTQDGTILTRQLVDVDGVLIDATDLSLSGTLNFNSLILVEGTDDDEVTDLSGNTGIRFIGDNGFTGDLILGNEDDGTFLSMRVEGVGSRGLVIESPFTGSISGQASIVVLGGDNIGIDIAAPFVGDITLTDGTITAVSGGGAGIRVSEQITGLLSIGTDIVVGQGPTFDDDGNLVDALPATAGVLVQDSITGGLLIQGIGQSNRIDTDDDGVDDTPASDAAISSFGGAPGILVGNETGGDALTLGTISEYDADLGYGFIIRSPVSSNGGSSGFATTGILLGQGSAVTIDGGILFDTGSSTAVAVDADAIGLHLGDGLTTPRLDFVGGGISSSTLADVTTNDDGTEEISVGGNAIGIQIDVGAELPVINNAATAIVVVANGTDGDAIAVRDLSGTLTEFYNLGADVELSTGTVSAGTIVASIGENGSGTGIAFDVQANTSGFSLYSSGSITGNILLGSGDDVVELDGIEQDNGNSGSGFLDGDIFFGLGAERLILRNNAEFFGSVSFENTLDLTIDNATINLASDDVLSVTSATLSNATISTFVDPSIGSAGQFEVTDTLSLSGELTIDATFQSFVPDETEFVLIDAANFARPLNDLSISLSESPFLFETELVERTINGRDQLVLLVAPLSADELGLTRRLTEFYAGFRATLDPDSQLEQAIANLADQDSVKSAFTALSPDFTNRFFEGALANQRYLNRNFSERLDDYIHKTENPSGLWAVEHGAIGQIDANDFLLNSDYLNVGLSLGYTGRLSDNFAIGIGTGFSLFGSSTDSQVGSDISVFAPNVTAHWLFKAGKFYAGGSGTATYMSVKRDRNLETLEIQRTVTSSSSAYNLNGIFETGFALEAGGFRLKPYGQISGTLLHEGAYEEEGGDSLNASIAAREIRRVDGRVAAALSYETHWSGRGDSLITVRPELIAGVDRQLAGDRNAALEVRYLTADEGFTIAGQGLTSDAEFAAASLSFFGGASTARVRYKYEDRDSVRIHSATFNFRLSF